MKTENRIRSQIIRQLNKMSTKKLKEIQKFLGELEENETQSKVLSYAGAWSDIDDSAMEDLTVNLIANRQKNQRRFDQ
ncbi:MAG: hypothetical protein BRD50_07805 [Bacteroidetes bacterium SW_11_45_7]|nr:MAG: hypothetical protein BRD50_07805 [Bacteroidetes bacterium SW_11_45_7]